MSLKFQKRQPSILIVSSFDSFVKSAEHIANHFAEMGVNVAHAVLVTTPRQVSKRQLSQSTEGNEIQFLDFAGLCSDDVISQYSGLILSLDGENCARIFRHLNGKQGYRPAIATLYPGFVFRHVFGGFALRAPADIVLLSCSHDLTLFGKMMLELKRPNNGRLFGLTQLMGVTQSQAGNQIKAKNYGPKRRTMCFFEQVAIPGFREEREFMAECLIKLAKKHPNWDVLVKPRTKPGEKTVQNPPKKHHIVSLLKSISSLNGIPSNLHVTFEAPETILERIEYCLTISSTIAAESIYRGINTALISDFGMNDDNGLHYFFGSGLLTSFEEFDPEKAMRPSKAWVNTRISNPDDNFVDFATEFLGLCMQAEKRELPKIELGGIYSSNERLKSIEARHGSYEAVTGLYQGQLANILFTPLVKLVQRLIVLVHGLKF